MPKEAGNAAVNFLNSYFTAKERDDNQKRWESEFKLEQENHAARMKAYADAQVEYEQKQADRAGKTEFYKAMYKSGAIPSPLIDTDDEFTAHLNMRADERAAAEETRAAEDQVRENDEFAYTKSQRVMDERARLAQVEAQEQANAENRRTKTAKDAIPDWLLDRYVLTESEAQDAMDQYNVANKQMDALRGALKDIMLDPTVKSELQKQMVEAQPILDEAWVQVQKSGAELSIYKDFVKKHGKKATEDQWGEFVKNIETEDKARIAQAEAEKKAISSAAEAAARQKQGAGDPDNYSAWDPASKLGRKFGGGKVGFNLKKAIDMKALPDDPDIKSMVYEALEGKEVIQGPDGKAKIIDTGEAYSFDPTDPIGLGLFAGVAGAGKAILKTGAKAAGKKAIRNVANEWQPNFDAPNFGGGIQNELRQLGYNPRAAGKTIPSGQIIDVPFTPSMETPSLLPEDSLAQMLEALRKEMAGSQAMPAIPSIPDAPDEVRALLAEWLRN